MNDLSKVSTSDLQVYATRMYSYISELREHYKRIEQVEQTNKIQNYDFLLLKSNMTAEITKVSKINELLQEELQKRFTKDVGVELNDDKIFKEISGFYDLLNAIHQQETFSLKQSPTPNA